MSRLYDTRNMSFVKPQCVENNTLYDRFWVVVATSFDQAFVSFNILDPAAKKVAMGKHAKDC